MPLGTTFREVIEMVRDECRLSSNTSRGIDHLANIKRVIRRHYRLLADEYDWRHLDITGTDGDKTLQAGESYYDYPAALNPLWIQGVWTQSGGTWIKLEYGITPADFNLLTESDPPLKWAHSSATGFDVWPTPASDGGTVRFIGQRLVTDLTEDTKRLDMDDELVGLLAASDILAANKQSDAELKMKQAQHRLFQIRRGYADKTRVSMVRGRFSDAPPPLTEAFIQSVASRS